MKKIIFSVLSFAFLLSAAAQEPMSPKEERRENRKTKIAEIAKQEEEGVITYSRHILGGLKLTTDGYGGFFEIGRAQTVRRGLLFQLEITEKKDQKEDKQQIPFGSSASPFIFGKINYFYPVKLGVQQQVLLANKGNKNGVSITANLGGGFSVGLLRPYKVLVDTGAGQAYIGIKDDTARFFDIQSYRGGPSLGTGFNELKIRPGLYGKGGIRFDYGKFNEMINALEVGLIAEYYFQTVPLVAFQPEKKFFFSGYVAIMFGKRKNSTRR